MPARAGGHARPDHSVFARRTAPLDEGLQLVAARRAAAGETARPSATRPAGAADPRSSCPPCIRRRRRGSLVRPGPRGRTADLGICQLAHSHGHSIFPLRSPVPTARILIALGQLGKLNNVPSNQTLASSGFGGCEHARSSELAARAIDIARCSARRPVFASRALASRVKGEELPRRLEPSRRRSRIKNPP